MTDFVFTGFTSPPSSGGLPPPDDERRTFRDAIRMLVPRWLRRRVGGGILHAIAAQIDDAQARLVAGVKLRFPGLYSDESLPLLGRERRIRRGRTETSATYATRLLPWLDHHPYRGGPYALLAQVHAFYAPSNFPVELRYASGRRFVLELDGTVTRGDIAWTPPGNPAHWARWWLIYEWPTPIESDGKWGDPGVWGDGGVWGSNLSPADVRDIRLVPREWNAAHPIGRVTLISTGITTTISVEST